MLLDELYLQQLFEGREGCPSSGGRSATEEQGMSTVWIAMPVQRALPDEARVQNVANVG